MRKHTLLNSPLASVISTMGHTDQLVIGDAGLPIPVQPVRIDLAVKQGVPAFMDVLETTTSELQPPLSYLRTFTKFQPYQLRYGAPDRIRT